MQAAVSTACLFPKPTEEALYDLCLAGIHRTEIFLNAPSEAETVFVTNLRDMLRRFGAACTAVHPWTAPEEGFMLFSPYKRRAADFIEQAKHIFEAMQILGAEYYILHGAMQGTCKDISLYCDRFHRLYTVGKTFGITVTQENVYRHESANLKFLREFCRILGDDAALTFDVKQAVRAGVNPTEAIESVGSHVRHLHISDHGPLGDCLRIGSGRFQVVPFLSLLQKKGFAGSVTLELYREAFDHAQQLCEDWQRLERLILRTQIK